MSLEGKMAPNFSLEGDDGEKVSLRDFRGKRVVLYFYPRDDTPGCTREACGFRDSMASLYARGAVVIGVSRDGRDKHLQFKEKYGLTFRLLSDPDHAVHEKYGAWGEKVLYGKTREGVIRSTVLIDETGRIVKHWPRVKPDGHAEQVLEALEALPKR